MRGASWVRQNTLEAYPDEELVVYAVWFNMVPSDDRDHWNPEALPDSRVQHFWDDDRVVGRWVTDNVEDCEHLGPIDWDSYYLFDGDGSWTEVFGGVKACGTPIYRTTEALAEAAAQLFSEPAE